MNTEVTPHFYSVAVDAPLLGPLTYAGPIEPTDVLLRGRAVMVPLGRRLVKGVVLGPSDQSGSFKIKPISSIAQDFPVLPDATLRWVEWLSKYYFYPVGRVASLCYPPLKKKGRGSRKSSPIPEMESETPLILTKEQSSVIKSIQASEGFKAHLLHGVTGSGKTEVYLKLLESVLAQKKRGLVLVPEISLTPQLLKRFAARFPGRIAVIHSHLTPREKTEQWWSMIDGERDILLGARSALFCPIADIGLIIVDEEHEPSFKQDEQLKYHARDAAIMMAHYQNCPIVLGSATPSLESWQNALSGRFQIHHMKSRVAERKMPEIEVIDMKAERSTRKSSEEEVELPFWISSKLYSSLQECFIRGDQAALFLNRRGVAQTVFCPSCGLTYECPNCSISLTLHGKNHLVCHYCDYNERLTDSCRDCGSIDVGPFGLGTELLETDMRRLFPQLKIARADRDEIQNRQDLEDLIFSFERQEIDLLIGTQMIAKGLDFKGLNLVGLVMADVGFNMPDFRASERSFQLLVQVSGRAGRHSELPGEVIIQTYNPLHPSITHAVQNDFGTFAHEELAMRKSLMYPPFGRIACFKIQGNSLEKVEHASRVLGQRCRQLYSQRPNYSEVQILGPAPAPLTKLRGKYRFQLLIKSPDAKRLSGFCHEVLGDESWIPSGSKIQIDIDPFNLL